MFESSLFVCFIHEYTKSASLRTYTPFEREAVHLYKICMRRWSSLGIVFECCRCPLLAAFWRNNIYIYIYCVARPIYGKSILEASIWDAARCWYEKVLDGYIHRSSFTFKLLVARPNTLICTSAACELRASRAKFSMERWIEDVLSWSKESRVSRGQEENGLLKCIFEN